MVQNTNDKQDSYKANSPSEKKVPVWLITVVAILAFLSVLLAVKLYINTRQRNSVKEDLRYVETEKNKLELELNNLITEYDSMKTTNDTLNLQLEAEQTRIKKLLNIQASNATKLQLYQRELETLRKVMRSYIIQIDSLNTRNRELTDENIMVSTQRDSLSSEYSELSKHTDELSSTVKLAQKLAAKNILAEGMSASSKPRDRASKVEKIRVCFTIRENAVAKADKKMIYVRILRPDGVVLSSIDAGFFEFQGESMIYSAKRELEYNNLDVDMCVFWDKTEELPVGTYSIILYSEGFEIGNTSLMLK